MITAWVLVVIVGTAPTNYHVWPGASRELLSRQTESYRYKSDCDNARRQALARAARLEGSVPKGQYRYDPVVTASCVAVEQKPTTKRNDR